MPDSSHLPDADRAPVVPIRYLVLVWLCLAAAITYAQRLPVNVAATTIQSDLDLSDKQMGWVFSAFFCSYALLQIPGGWLADRWGSRAALAACVTFCSFSAMGTAAAAGMTSLIVMRLGVGTGQAGVFPACTASVARWFPGYERAIASGLLTGFMSLGGVVATWLGGMLMAPLGWRGMFVLYGLPGLAWAAGFYLWFRNDPSDHKSVSRAELASIHGAVAHDPIIERVTVSDDGLPHVAESTPWFALLSSVSMWLIAWQQFFRAAGYALFASWMPKYVEKVYGSTVEESGIITSVALAGVVIGSPLGGWLSDALLRRTGSRRIGRQGLAIGTMVACALFFIAAYFQDAARPAALLIAGAAFFGAIPGPIVYALTIDMGGRHVAPVFSIMNMAGNIGAFAFPIVVGWLVEDELLPWQNLPLFMAGIYWLGTLCWLALDPRGTVFDNRASAAT